MTNYNKIYGNRPNESSKKEIPLVDDSKNASRVIGGLKAQSAHKATFNIDGKLITIPKVEYVEQLERQVKSLKDENKHLKQAIDRMDRNFTLLNNKMKEVEYELTQKIDKNHF